MNRFEIDKRWRCRLEWSLWILSGLIAIEFDSIRRVQVGGERWIHAATENEDFFVSMEVCRLKEERWVDGGVKKMEIATDFGFEFEGKCFLWAGRLSSFFCLGAAVDERRQKIILRGMQQQFLHFATTWNCQWTEHVVLVSQATMPIWRFALSFFFFFNFLSIPLAEMELEIFKLKFSETKDVTLRPKRTRQSRAN